MLVDFKVTNFRSFKNEQEFSMQTGERLRKYNTSNTVKILSEKLLKSSLIFGANANGKTNLILALATLKHVIMYPTSNIEQELNSDTFGNNDNSTKFEITFIRNQKKFYYFLEYTSLEVQKEILKVNERYIFKRQQQDFRLLPEQLIPISTNIRKNQLLLYFAQQNNEPNSNEAYLWFAQDLIFVDADNIDSRRLKILSNQDFKKQLLSFIQAADFDIIDIEVKKRKQNLPELLYQIVQNQNMEADEDQNVPEIPKQITVYDLFCKHRSKDNTFTLNLREESRGTKIFINLALYILENTNKVLLIDEFDMSYHFELANALVLLINNEIQSNQFILTTHNLPLMDSNLRQDQIWFAEKNRYGESELFSLFDFDDPALKRNDFNYKRRYLEGRYGATQMVNLNSILEILKENKFTSSEKAKLEKSSKNE
ncbi:AAA domain-containing protein, putative AbiEii toxin, Type IV TA system [Lactobacillus apis]|uniref:AAA family ATPase n=2 Tax=Lactobacillus apis TaxID=303541 RepID=UPI000815CDF4|nr:ATP-binding protein [Lactobacillus apis]GGG35040.1 transporter [Lactobacillus apis]SCB84045.1 AAA domain-containing protein, putative AbiEii toxin, Type IV TA system [Lactobacillus apis]